MSKNRHTATQLGGRERSLQSWLYDTGLLLWKAQQKPHQSPVFIHGETEASNDRKETMIVIAGAQEAGMDMGIENKYVLCPFHLLVSVSYHITGSGESSQNGVPSICC